MNGLLLVNKTVGISSYAVVSSIKRIYHTKKVGHCGTLDPFASGLLVIVINQATKISSFVENNQKTYQATLLLGQKTNSGDLEGEVIETAPVPTLSETEIQAVLNSFLGESMQIPPMFSALKVQGQPLYKLARKGQTVERKSRPITIYCIKLLKYTAPLLVFKVTVSKGTYIRTLGEDIAQKLGTVGHLINLERTQIGNFSLKDAWSIQQITDKTPLIPIEEGLRNLPSVVLSEQEVRLASYGQPLKLSCQEPTIVLLSNEGQAIAIYELKDGLYRCLRGI